MIGMLRHGSCLGAGRRFDDLCDGELTAKVEARVRRHLAGCPRCRRHLARLEATIATLAQFGAGPVPEVGSVRDEVATELTAEYAVEHDPDRPAPGQTR